MPTVVAFFVLSAGTRRHKGSSRALAVCWTELCVADKDLKFKALINVKGLIKLYDSHHPAVRTAQ